MSPTDDHDLPDDMNSGDFMPTAPRTGGGYRENMLLVSGLGLVFLAAAMALTNFL